ncbi:MAG: cell division protein FtsB [Gemmatimonadales bacterium]|nr:cell division protein FtsB [Gemmatimonadales bacterium]
MTPGRWATIIGLALALYFALQGGEYGTLDLLQLRRDEAEEQAEVQRLQRLVDSLTQAAVAIELDPRTQERAARERFGMIKQGEFLYRLVPSNDSVSSKR